MNTHNIIDHHDHAYFIHICHIVGDKEKNYIYMILPTPNDPNELHIYSYEPERCIIRFIGIHYQNKNMYN